MGWRRPAAIVALGVASAFALGSASPAASPAGPGGGTFRVLLPAQQTATIDPAVNALPLGWGAVWYATCANLMTFRDAPAPRGFTLRPEAATGPPEISHGGRRYVFTVRRSLRFSDGTRLTAANFKYALERVLSPVMASEGAPLYSDIKAVSAVGRKLRIDLTRAAGDLTMRLALAYACPVPTNYQLDPRGVPLLVGSGPYYVRTGDPNRIVIERNPYYRGSRPRHLERIVIAIGGTVASNVRAVEQGEAEAIGGTPPFEYQESLARTYGVNKGQFFRFRGTIDYFLVMNTSRPIFKRNAALRRAVNLALNRSAIANIGSGFAHSQLTTDQIVPHWVGRWKDHRVYPAGPTNLRRAKKLAAGNLRGGKVVLYAAQVPFLLDQANLIGDQLSQIGLDVTVTPVSPQVLEFKAGKPGEPYDMALTRYFVHYPDPADVVNRLLGGENARRSAGNTNLAYFDNERYNRLMAAAHRLTGPARLRAFSKLDASIMRDKAPWAPLYEGSHWLFVSKRVSCLKAHPVFRFDFGAGCLR